MSRIIAIGDIHGKLEKLERLISKLAIGKDDEIIFLGDYIDRGEDSRGVIDYIINLGVKCNVITLKGNHEDLVLCSKINPHSHMVGCWMSNGGYQTLNSYIPDDIFEVHGDFFEDLPLTHETENHIFVHGYLNSDIDVAEQNPDLCLWGRFDDIKPHKSGKIVVCGHTIQRWEPVDLGYKICIDTGSFKDEGCITALVIDGNKSGFVNSR